MNLLILGGTVFVGRHLVEAATGAGHMVTLFNRGQHNADLFPDVEKLRGDRSADGGLDALNGRTWDAVIDTCGYFPRVVKASAQQLAGSVGQYVFISSISVYADFTQAHQDETAAVGTLDDPTTEKVTGETSGPLKVLCEQAAEAAFPGKMLTIRPGYIVGPHDPTDRFTYWPQRVAQGGDILAPGGPGEPMQFIDARDLAAWTVAMIEAGKTGIYNATGPAAPLTFGTMLETCRAVSESDARFVWADENFLSAREISLPLFAPAAYRGISQVSIARAVQDGLTFRPLAETVRDTLAWDKTRPADHEWRAGLPREREWELLNQLPTVATAEFA